MRRFSNIDNQFMTDHGLSINEAYVLEWILNLPVWAQREIVSKTTYYFASKNKAVEDLPMITTKVDTMYRIYKRLEEKGLVKNYKIGNKDFIQILEKCSDWNAIRKTEANPEESGRPSEKKPDSNPINSILKNNSSKDSSLFSQEIQKNEEALEGIPKTVIKFLNAEKPSKTPFQFTDTNISYIESRIKEGFKLNDFKKVILFKVREWKDNDKMKKFIRPETLFGNKFNRYLVEANDFGFINDGSNNFEFKPQKNAEML